MRPVICAALFMFLSANAAHATVIDFSNQSGSYSPLPSPYDGLNFNNFYEISYFGNFSGVQSIYNSSGAPADFGVSSGSFTLNGFDITAQDDPDEIDITATVLGGGTLTATLFENYYTTDSVVLDFANVTDVSFSTPGGEYFAITNIDVNGVVSPTPEPSSLVLLGTGILSAAGAARRKFRKV